MYVCMSKFLRIRYWNVLIRMSVSELTLCGYVGADGALNMNSNMKNPLRYFSVG